MEPPTATEREAIVKFYLGDKAWTSADSFSSFLTFYHRTTNSQAFRFATCQVDEPIITSHPQLQRLVQQLRDNPRFTRKQFEAALSKNDDISEQELRHTVKVIVKLAFMLDCTKKELSAKSVYNFQLGMPGWEPDQSFLNFIASSFPKQKPNHNESSHSPAIYAWKLKQRCKVIFERTDEISEHLLYDRNSRTLKVFHQMFYLRMQLQRYTYPIENMSLEESLRRGTLPPQLILETLESFYELLFPIAIDDGRGRSRRLLKQLIKKNGFDPQILTRSHARWVPENFTYVYWGDRLKELGELLKKPPPTTNWMSWLEERTSERNALMIAIIGLFLSALFGLIGCIIGAAQLWIAVLAWKDPE